MPKNRSVRESRDELPAQGGLRFSVGAVYDRSVASVRFEGEAAKLVDGVVDVTGTLLAYGQTGAGKTFTVLGRGGTPGRETRRVWCAVPERLFATAMKRRQGVAWMSGCRFVKYTMNIEFLRPPPEKGQRWACPSPRGTVDGDQRLGENSCC